MLVPAIAFSWWLASLSGAAGAPFTSRLAASSTIGSRPASFSLSTALEPPTAIGDPRPAPPSPDAVWDADGDDNDSLRRPRERAIYRGLITSAIARAARSYLDLPMGSERTAVVDGESFVFVLEPHYHPPGFVGAPNGWHKGVSVYVPRDL